MKGISRRATACAVVAAAGRSRSSPARLSRSAAIRRPSATVCRPVREASSSSPTAATSPTAAASPAGSHRETVDEDARRLGMNVANAGLTVRAAPPPRRTECRWNRLDALFGYFAAKGSRQRRAVRPRRPAGQRPTSTVHTALPRAARQARPARRRLARQHDRGRLARARHGRQDPRPRLRSAPAASRTRRAAVLRHHAPHRRDAEPPRQVLGRERRRPRLLPQPPAASSATATSTTASARRRGRSSWSASTRATCSRRSTPAGPPTRTTIPRAPSSPA